MQHGRQLTAQPELPAGRSCLLRESRSDSGCFDRTLIQLASHQSGVKRLQSMFRDGVKRLIGLILALAEIPVGD